MFTQIFRLGRIIYEFRIIYYFLTFNWFYFKKKKGIQGLQVEMK